MIVLMTRVCNFQLYGNQIYDTFLEGSAGVSNKKFRKSEGIKYKTGTN